MTSWMDMAGTLCRHAEARWRERHIRTRDQLLAHQRRRWQWLSRRVARAAPFYADGAGLAFEQWPRMDKRSWMRHFNTINTVGVTLDDALAVAEHAEHTRDFRPMLGDIAVGMSTGTSGCRGIFLASAGERRRWAGTMLAKLLPQGLRGHERVALLLRAGNNLYDSVEGGRLQFRFIDQLQPFDAVLQQLDAFAPTILVGSARALALVAQARQDGYCGLAPLRVISVAEVLDPLDRTLMERVWGVRVEQIYQATEGFLGHTCVHGTIHLNEDCLIFEQEWLDRGQRRFVPIVTDLYRMTQPVIRYRLNDVLVERAAPCPCGSVHMAIERIEGREDDVVWLPSRHSMRDVPIFADNLTRAVLGADRAMMDYQIDQVGKAALRIGVSPAPDASRQAAIRTALAATCARMDAVMPELMFFPLMQEPHAGKRRRVRGLSACQGMAHA